MDNKTTGIDPKLLDEMHDDLCDGIRNEVAIAEADLIEIERAAMHIDPAKCESGMGKLWCPRCGFGCCSIIRDPNDRDSWICSGGCNHAGEHTYDPSNLVPVLEASIRREQARRAS